jgi:hypothetical protein
MNSTYSTVLQSTMLGHNNNNKIYIIQPVIYYQLKNLYQLLVLFIGAGSKQGSACLKKLQVVHPHCTFTVGLINVF